MVLPVPVAATTVAFTLGPQLVEHLDLEGVGAELEADQFGWTLGLASLGQGGVKTLSVPLGVVVLELLIFPVGVEGGSELVEEGAPRTRGWTSQRRRWSSRSRDERARLSRASGWCESRTRP